VRDLAGQAGVPAPDLPVAHDRGADALAQEHVDEVPAAVFGASCPVDVVVDGDGAGHQAGEHGGAVERADEEGSVGQLDEPPGLAIDRVGGADDGKPHRTGGDLSRHACERAADVLGSGGTAHLRLRAREHVAVDVDRLGHDALGGDARHQRAAGVGRQRVVGADAAAAGGALAGVDHRAGGAEAPDALRDGRLRQAGRERELRARGPPLGHQRSQHVLVRQRPQQLERRLRGGHARILVRTLV
jgi:hypothetical protein